MFLKKIKIISKFGKIALKRLFALFIFVASL